MFSYDVKQIFVQIIQDFFQFIALRTNTIDKLNYLPKEFVIPKCSQETHFSQSGSPTLQSGISAY